MKLPKKLISEFAKVTNNTDKPKNETTVYGVIVKNGDSTYAQLDGSDVLTPVSTTTDTKDGDRVTVLIKNHTAIVTGNMTSPAARTNDVQEIGSNVQQLDDDNAIITGKLTAVQADIETLKTGTLSAEEADLKYATIANLNAANAEIDNLEATHASFETATAKNFEAVNAKIDTIDVGDLSAKYAQIDFANIGKAAMEYLYSKSGLIENVVVSEGTITGNLVGVTIKGDLIEGNTVVADKLVIKGQNGLYYKLNTDGMTVEAQQTEYNSLNGSVITAKSITATKIAVDDLVAFDATIGGFNITSDEIYSGVKAGINNTTQGIYLGKDGQVSIGDSQNYLKYYKTSDGSYKLELSFDGTAIDDASKTATNFLSYDDTNGLQVGNKSAGSWSGYRTQIKSNAFNILDSSGSTVASYGSNLIELGKNSTDSVIKLCGGEGTISYGSDGFGGSSFQIKSVKPSLSGNTAVTLSCNSTTSELQRSLIRVFPDQIYMYSAATSSVASSIDMQKTYVYITADSTIKLAAPTIQDSSGYTFFGVTRGSSGNWEYKKWSNGDVELWGSCTVSGAACTTALGNMYRTASIVVPSFPFTVYTPNVTASYETAGYGAFLWANGTSTTDKPSDYYLVRPNSTTIQNGKINFHVYGKWKT